MHDGIYCLISVGLFLLRCCSMMIIRHVDVTWRQSTERHLYIIDYCPGIGKEERRAGAYCVVSTLGPCFVMNEGGTSRVFAYLPTRLTAWCVFGFGHWTAAQCLGLVRDKKEKGEGGEVNMRHPKGNDCDGANYQKDDDPTEYVKEGSPFESNWCAPRTVRWSDKKGSHQRVSQQLQIDRLILPLSGIIASYIFLSTSHERPSSSKFPSSIEMESSDPRRGWNRKERSKRDR